MVSQNTTTTTATIPSTTLTEASQRQVQSVLLNESVSNHACYVSQLLKNLQFKVQNFQAGRLPRFKPEWLKLTSDPEILDIVSGYSIEFSETPSHKQIQQNHQCSSVEQHAIDTEISKLFKKGVIIRSLHERGEFISPIFVCPKKDGTHRMILNLKALNVYVEFHHFKMDTLWSVIKLIKPNCFMASVDLKDAYYTVPVALASQKFLKFEWKGQLYQYTCLPNGLSSCPRKFTKLLKPYL